MLRGWVAGRVVERGKEKYKMSETMDLALIMLQEVRDALARGTKHYRISDDKLLTSEKEILEALLSEGSIILDCNQQRDIG